METGAQALTSKTNNNIIPQNTCRGGPMDGQAMECDERVAPVRDAAGVVLGCHQLKPTRSPCAPRCSSA